MSRTKKDRPWRVIKELPDYRGGWPGSGDSGFRKTRKWMKRNRSKHVRRFAPEAYDNGARAPYNGLKRTWDFE